MMMTIMSSHCLSVYSFVRVLLLFLSNSVHVFPPLQSSPALSLSLSLSLSLFSPSNIIIFSAAKQNNKCHWPVSCVVISCILCLLDSLRSQSVPAVKPLKRLKDRPRIYESIATAIPVCFSSLLLLHHFLPTSSCFLKNPGSQVRNQTIHGNVSNNSCFYSLIHSQEKQEK